MGPHHHFRHFRAPTDMRRRFCGLCGLVRSGLNRDLLSGEVFVLINRRRMHIELLKWDRNGLLLYDTKFPSTLAVSGADKALAIWGVCSCCGATGCASLEVVYAKQAEGLFLLEA